MSRETCNSVCDVFSEWERDSERNQSEGNILGRSSKVRDIPARKKELPENIKQVRALIMWYSQTLFSWESQYSIQYTF